MLELYTINRCALLVRPSKAMIDWLNTIFPTHPVSYTEHMEQDNTDVYLIPEVAFLDDAKEWLKINYQPIFESILYDWCADEDLWPSPLDWVTFEQFCDYTIQSNVQDTVSAEEDEEYDDMG
ncbi:MAG: hypothetical protein AAGJ93_02220 [Bacteroidota bacterium]